MFGRSLQQAQSAAEFGRTKYTISSQSKIACHGTKIRTGRAYAFRRRERSSERYRESHVCAAYNIATAHSTNPGNASNQASRGAEHRQPSSPSKMKNCAKSMPSTLPTIAPSVRPRHAPSEIAIRYEMQHTPLVGTANGGQRIFRCDRFVPALPHARYSLRCTRSRFRRGWRRFGTT